MTVNDKIINTMIKLRKIYGISQTDMSKRLEMNLSNLSEIENGRTKVNLDFLGKYAEILKLKPHEIIMLSEYSEDELVRILIKALKEKIYEEI